MLNVGTKVNYVSGTPTANMYEGVNEYNDHNVELQGAVTNSGQTLSGANTNQLARAMFINAVGAPSFQENTPVANQANLTPWTGASGLVIPDAYSEMHGAELAFNHSIASTTNSTTGFTVNIGQTVGTYLGNQYLTNPDGTALQPGVVYGYTVIRYNYTNTRWELVSSQGLSAFNQQNPKNWAINGCGQVSTRGTSFANGSVLTGAYLWDRWIAYLSNKGGVTTPASQVYLSQAVTDELPLLNEGAATYMRFSPAGAGSGFAATDYFGMQQYIWNGAVKIGGGRALTITFKARASFAGKKLGINAQQYYGSGGTANDVLVGNYVTLSTTFTKYTITLNTLSLTGKTIAPTYLNDDALIVQFFIEWGATFGNANFGYNNAETFGGSGTIDITEVQVMPANCAIPFQPTSYDEEMTRTQHYYSDGVLNIAGNLTMIDGAGGGAGGDFINVTTAASTYTITLPLAANNIGRIIKITKVDAGAGTVIIAPPSGDTIDGITYANIVTNYYSLISTIYQQYASIIVQSNGTGWTILQKTTKYGRDGAQQYLGGSTYNNVALNITATSCALVRGVFIPYQTWDGTWRLIFNISMTGSSVSGAAITIAGVAFKNVANYYQAVSGFGYNAANNQAYISGLGSNTVQISCNATASPMTVSGEVELDSKPTWIA